ncbi:hypothetical protein [Candidatus Clostridium stratigraminis]|uniref:hypothetical protein n=1 Tax=Candidatus Clostridium stratigraminis TaxID=3381661 RepID=UPI003877D26D
MRIYTFYGLKFPITSRVADVPETDPKGIPLGCACAGEGMCLGKPPIFNLYIDYKP